MTDAIAADFSTPERALASLEDAYARKDLEAAVAAKDFVYEGRAMLENMKNLPQPPDDDLIKQAAEVLELSFRKEMQTKGFPDFSQLRCKVVSSAVLRADLVELVEECTYSDGGKSRQSIHTAKNERGWHVVVLPTKS